MANSMTHAGLPFPVRNAKYTILVPYLDATGSPTDPTTPDTEISKDGAAFADCANEVATISGSNGMGFITFDGAEMNCAVAGIAAKVASGPKPTLAVLSPRALPVVATGTAQAGGNNTIRLQAGTTINPLGMIVRTTGGTGGGGAGGADNQARVITGWNAGTLDATVPDNWEVNPDATTTYDLLLTDMAVNMVLAAQVVVGGYATGQDPAALLDARLDTLDGYTDELEGLLKDASSGLAALKAYVDEVESLLKDSGSGLPTLKGYVDEVESLLKDSGFGLATLKGYVDEVESLLKDPSSGLAALAGFVDALEARLPATLPELEAGTPPTNPTPAQAWMFLYMALRNGRKTTNDQTEILNDAGETIARAALSDDNATFVHGKFGAPG